MRWMGWLGAIVTLAACEVSSPAVPTPANTLDTPITIQETLAADDMAGRRYGTEGNAKARTYLLEQLANRGLPPLGDTFEHPFKFLTRQGEEATGINLVAEIAGSDGDGPTIVVTAHYDHVGVINGEIYNGADDNASGVAGLFAVADAFLADPPKHTLVLALLDAEEAGLHGARAFLAQDLVARDQLALNVNLDMLSKNTENELYAAGAYHTPALAPIITDIASAAPVNLLMGHDDPALGSDDWTLQSDHGPFHRAGIPFVYFGVEDHPDYHRPSDDFETVPVEFFERSLKTVVMAVRTLDERLGEIG